MQAKRGIETRGLIEVTGLIAGEDTITEALQEVTGRLSGRVQFDLVSMALHGRY